ncbi:MAG: universal stress protein [Lentisphaeria bacterium]|nr:universal stress protein [Lentisphaeria bacterium]
MNMLVAVDFSETTDVVMKEAEKLALALAGRVWVLHVAPPDPDFIGYDPGPQAERDYIARQRHREHCEVQDLARQLKEKGIQATAVLAQGDTAAVILEQADQLEADMIILGTHGHGAVYHLIAGSVSKGVIKRAVCPVYVVPSRVNR